MTDYCLLDNHYITIFPVKCHILTKFKFKIDDGCHVVKMLVFGHNSAMDCPVFANFCMMMQILTIIMVKCHKKYWTFKLVDDHHLETLLYIFQ